ncbi:MAG TPA: helix-turn-helix domain-containing protein [Steroidobacteraceae bacterium]|nr:helix-turn-helix domain-containing protein [Steroidobacteraceae bacterium]
MSEGPNIARVAQLLGDPARAEMLSALMGGQALTATELAATAGITKQTASAHLSKLLNANLLNVQHQGRHRYFQLEEDVAGLMETIMGVAYRSGAVRLRSSPREPALREARVCYDHLAGDKGVQLFEALLTRELLRRKDNDVVLTADGRAFFKKLGIDLDELATRRRPLCRTCLDWSVRRHHLGGALGAALLELMIERQWARRRKGSRLVIFSAAGEAVLKRRFFC